MKVMESCRRSKAGLTEMPGSVFLDVIRSEINYSTFEQGKGFLKEEIQKIFKKN